MTDETVLLEEDLTTEEVQFLIDLLTFAKDNSDEESETPRFDEMCASILEKLNDGLDGLAVEQVLVEDYISSPSYDEVEDDDGV